MTVAAVPLTSAGSGSSLDAIALLAAVRMTSLISFITLPATLVRVFVPLALAATFATLMNIAATMDMTMPVMRMVTSSSTIEMPASRSPRSRRRSARITSRPAGRG